MICDNRTWEICLARWQIKKEWVTVSLAGYYQYGRRSPACPLADKPHQIGNPTNMQTSPKAQRTQKMSKKWNNPNFGQNLKTAAKLWQAFVKLLPSCLLSPTCRQFFPQHDHQHLLHPQQPESHQSSLVNRSESINDLLTRPDNAMIESYNQNDPSNLRAACFWVISK